MGISWSVGLREDQVYDKAKGDTDRKNWATLNSALNDETAARESVDAEIIADKAALWTALQDETTLRAQDDYELRQEFLNITSSETSIRAAADVSLKAALDSDITTVKALIESEKQERITNDSAVIEQVNNKYDPQITDINTALANEVTLSANRDATMFSALSASITAEQTARQSGDAALQTSINNLSNSAINSIRAEQTARQSADATLQQNIDKVAASITSGSFTVEEFKPSSTTQEGKAGILPAPPKLQTEDQILLPTNFGWKSLADTNIFIGTTPSQKFVPSYTGSVIYPQWNDYEEQKMSVSGDLSATAAGTYTVQFTPVGLYCWSDGTRGARSVQWTIAPALIAIPTAATTTFEYTGNVISLNPANVDLNKMTKSGTDSATEQGNYAVTYTLKDSANVHWSNNSTTPVTINWKIEIKQLDKPTAANTTFDYDGKTKTLKVTNYNASFMNMSGTTSTVNAGSYSVTYSLKNKTSMRWKDGTTTDVTINWVVNRQKLSYDESNLTSNPLEYTGNAQSVSLNGYNSAKHVLSGDTTKTAAGSYTVTVTPNSNYEWYEGGYGGKQITWTIGNLSFPKPTAATTTFTYTGNSISLNVQNVNLTYMDKTGSDTATAKGTYWVKYTLKSSSYTWDDGSKDAVTINWSIGENTVAIPTLSKTDYTYSGSSIAAQITNGASDKFTVTGTTAAVNAGTYTITYTLNDKTNTKWTDGTTTNKTVEWTIKRKNLTAAQSTFTPKTITYDGNAKNLADNLTGYNATYHDLSSQTSMTNAGTYTAKVAPKANYAWNDGTYAAKTVSWTINPKSVTKPTAAKTSFDYDGATKTLSISGYDTNYMTQSGTTSASAKGSYTVTFTLKSTTNYQWADGTTAAYVITWTIGANSVAKPTLSGTTSFTYDGNAKSVTVNGYDSTTMTFSGTISETNAGDYTATYSLKDKTNYAWDDGTNADVVLNWSIARKKLTATQSNLSMKQSTYTWDGVYSNSLNDLPLSGLVGTLEITGSNINNFNSSYHEITGGNYTWLTQSAKQYNYSTSTTFTVEVSPKQNYSWNDGTTDAKVLTFKITEKLIDKPAISGNSSFTYDGTTKSISVTNYVANYMKQSGTTSASNVNSYQVTYTLYQARFVAMATNSVDVPLVKWKDGTTDTVTINWQISAGSGITKPTLSTTEYAWTGGSISPTVSGYNSATMNVSGTSTQSAVGTYTLTYSLKDKTNTKWADGTTADVSLTWKIVRQKLTNDVTVDSGVTLTYNGSTQQPTLKYGSVQWTMANLATYCDVTSQTSATDAGTYTFKATPKSTYAWKDGTYAAKSFSWTIERKKLDYDVSIDPNVKLRYNGNSQEPTLLYGDIQWTIANLAVYCDLSGKTSGIDRGSKSTYNFTATPKSNYAWVDGSTESQTFEWLILAVILQKPTLTNYIFNYDGNEHSPVLTGYDSNLMYLTGTTSAIEPNTYYFGIKLIDDATIRKNYFMDDGDGDNIYPNTTTYSWNYEWYINKGTQNLTLSNQNVTLNNDTQTVTVTASFTAGTLTATSANTNLVTATVNGNNIVLKGVGFSDSTVNVTVNVSSSGYGNETKIITVTPNYIKNLNACSWAEIKKIIAAGKADVVWQAGDSKSFSMSVNYHNPSNNATGTETINFDSVILGFNHNPSYERTSSVQNYVDFFIRSGLNTSLGFLFDEETYDSVENTSNSVTYNGVKCLTLRAQDWQNSLKSMLPSELQDVITSAKKYFVAPSGVSSTTYSGLWSLDVGEIVSMWDLLDETQPYAYFLNGNTYNAGFGYINADGKTAKYWTRSYTLYNNKFYYYYVDSSGNRGNTSINRKLQILPCFRIGG